MVNMLFIAHRTFTSELGERVTTQFDTFDEQLCQSHWYFYPIEMQRIVLIFMLDSQQLVSIRGFGSIVCCRGFFQSVSLHVRLHSIQTYNNIIYDFRQTINGAFSYFMALQHITAWTRGTLKQSENRFSLFYFQTPKNYSCRFMIPI